MSGDVTYQALKRLTYLPERDDRENGTVIAGQDYFNVYFTGGSISNVTISGATINTANTITFNPLATSPYERGKLFYDSTNESLTFYNNDSNVALQVGQEEWIRVFNNSGVPIPNGRVVYLSGASGGMPTIALAQSNAAATTIGAGLTTETIANNSIGYVTCIGLVRGIDTSAFTAGQTVYISSTTAGGLTATAPVSPNYRYRVGIVGMVDAVNGSIHVTPSTASLGNGTANQVVGINTDGTMQEYKTIVAGTGVSVTPTAGTITIANTGVTSVSGTANRISITGTTTPAIDISAAYVGQTSITTLGTIVTGTWQGAVVNSTYGGTGVNNGGRTITVAGNLTHAGAFTQTFTATANTSVTLPTSGTLYGSAANSITSAQLATSLTDETGSGSAVFGTSPTISGATLTTSSVNGVTLTNAGSALNYLNAAGSYTAPLIVDRAYAAVSTGLSSSVQIPVDNTIPQNTEGTQFISVTTNALKSATNRLRVRFIGYFGASTLSNNTIALFVGANVNAVSTTTTAIVANTYSNTMALEYEFVPGTTAAQTFSLRFGPNTGTMYVNRVSTGDLFGGTSICTLIVEEITA